MDWCQVWGIGLGMLSSQCTSHLKQATDLNFPTYHLQYVGNNYHKGLCCKGEHVGKMLPENYLLAIYLTLYCLASRCFRESCKHIIIKNINPFPPFQQDSCQRAAVLGTCWESKRIWWPDRSQILIKQCIFMGVGGGHNRSLATWFLPWSSVSCWLRHMAPKQGGFCGSYFITNKMRSGLMLSPFWGSSVFNPQGV